MNAGFQKTTATTSTAVPTSVADLQMLAVALAAQHRGQLTTGIYVAGSDTKLTKERAFAQMLEAHPEVYAEFRDRHNAEPLLRQLTKAGVPTI